ncbi:MAG: efflux RND transporter periplasmic adaptor subunit [Rickettsiales bacterium]|jgi:HlyD family secretion protein|nr:efflux RND transporter periplasmic adaptor subunit [Rickettsiales bacterium]
MTAKKKKIAAGIPRSSRGMTKESPAATIPQTMDPGLRRGDESANETAKPKKRFRVKKRWVLVAAVAIAVAIGWAAIPSKKKDDAAKWVSAPVSFGHISQVVTATGEITPVNTINVGAQVSGIIEKILVDYNDVVEKDQVLLEIDKSTLQASLDEAAARLKRAETQRDLAKADYQRDRKLYNSGFIARAELDKSKANYESLIQDYNSAKSQYDRAVANLGYTTIRSPVSGTIIARKVDEGQTVSASLQAPDLFVVAEDLSKMQIATSISEADIGVIKQGQKVSFSVDAYPAKTFEGFVRQVRLSPSMTQNVVVYTVIIDVDNASLELMPGMTAFVTITVSEKDDVWKAPNSAFLVRDLSKISDDDRVVSGEMTAKDTLAILREGKVVLVPFKKGMVTSIETEIIAEGLQKGDRIITGKVGQAAANSSGGGMPKGNLGGPGGGGGGGGGFGSRSGAR